MNMQRWKRFAPDLGVVAFISLLGASFAQLIRPEAPDYWLLAGGGAVAGAVLLGLLGLFGTGAPEPESVRSSGAEKGTKIAAWGLVLAFLGWPLAVFVSFPLGFGLAVIGILVGAFGSVLHFANLVSRNDG